jgi:FKBP-type peptidyl-prolyl cis-trans isomerase
LGVWYDDQSTQQTNQAELQQGQVAQQTQTQNMNELNIKDTTVGTGTEVKSGDTVSVLYTGSLDDGTVFDASSKHGNQPFSFTVGAGQVIKGWDLGLVGMKIGGTRELIIPASLGYGASANGPIPANATLHFTIQLLSVSSTVNQ